MCLEAVRNTGRKSEDMSELETDSRFNCFLTAYETLVISAIVQEDFKKSKMEDGEASLILKWQEEERKQVKEGVLLIIGTIGREECSRNQVIKDFEEEETIDSSCHTEIQVKH